jgi:hypothetical protein
VFLGFKFYPPKINFFNFQYNSIYISLLLYFLFYIHSLLLHPLSYPILKNHTQFLKRQTLMKRGSTRVRRAGSGRGSRRCPPSRAVWRGPMRSAATRPYRDRARRHLTASRPRSGRRQKRTRNVRSRRTRCGQKCRIHVRLDATRATGALEKPNRVAIPLRRGCMRSLALFTLPPVGTAKPGNDPAQPNAWVASPPETCGRDARHGRPRIREWQRRRTDAWPAPHMMS